MYKRLCISTTGNFASNLTNKLDFENWKRFNEIKLKIIKWKKGTVRINKLAGKVENIIISYFLNQQR